MGDQFPDIRSLTVHNVQLDDAEQRIENLDLLLDINYIGNFSTSIDADMVLGKKGSIMLKGMGYKNILYYGINIMSPSMCSETTVRHGASAVHT